MKKLLPIMMSLCIAVSCAACSSSDVSPTPNVSETLAASGTPVPETAMPTEALTVPSDVTPEPAVRPVQTIEYPEPEKYFSRVLEPFSYYDAPSFYKATLDEIPLYDSENYASFELNLMGTDLSNLDLSDNLDELMHSDFDTNTIWPYRLPEGFDPEVIIDYGKDPGLGIKSLHELGITGAGVSIGIIDQELFQNHVEYRDNLVYYEEIPVSSYPGALHGSGVASIAVGKNVGVAPDAHLYYIAATLFDIDEDGNEFLTYKYRAEALNRLLDINETLPENEKIRVVSMSRGYDNEQDLGYSDIMAAMDRAKDAGVLVVSTSFSEIYGFKFSGLGRDPMCDPNDLTGYSVGIWQKDDAMSFSWHVFFPMDSRTVAACTGENDYMWNASGGWSWTVPYIAGVYALCAQVYPDITPDMFWEYVMNTADSVKVDNFGKSLLLRYLANPVRLIAELQNLND